MARKIVVIHPHAERYADGLRAACPDADIVPVREKALGMQVPPDEALDEVADADAIVSIARWIRPDFMAACRKLKWFQCLITGTDHLNDLLKGRDVVLTNARGIHGTQMSELAVLHMLVHMRRVPAMVRNQDAHHWERFTPRVLRDRTVAILGTGLIAEKLAGLCKALDMTTVGVTRTPREIAGFDRVEPRARMLDVVADADFVVLLLPLTEENRAVVDARFLKAMKPDACLINIARGGIVDESALIEALNAGQIAGAGLDVFDTSPLPADSPLWALENVFITPHVGGQSDRYDDDAMPIVTANARAFLDGRIEAMINRVAL